MEKKLPTIKEIAKRLNVSVSTVSRALHDHPSIGLRTKSQVQKLAQEMHYEPNQKAIFFKQGKTFVIGVVIPNLQEEYFSIAINGIEDVAVTNHYNVMISQSRDNMEREIQIIDSMRRNRVDGVLVSVSKSTSSYEHFRQLKDFNIPIVFFDRIPEMEEAHSVSCSIKKTTVEMVNMLVQKGHRHIALISGKGNISQFKERLSGYREGLKRNKLKEENTLIVQTDLTTAGTERAMSKLLALKNPPTAVIAFNDYVSLDAMRFAKKQGLKINEDISFASYANLPVTSYLDTPPVASIEQFPYQQAEKAMKLLLEIINNKAKEAAQPPQKIVIESKLVLHL